MPSNKKEWKKIDQEIADRAMAYIEAKKVSLTKHLNDVRGNHIWKLEEDGNVDVWGLDAGYHNGPKCILCGYSYCYHCHDEPPVECTAKLCTSCGIKLVHGICIQCGAPQ